MLGKKAKINIKIMSGRHYSVIYLLIEVNYEKEKQL